MLKIKNKKEYSFKYVIYWKNGTKTAGEIKNSCLHPYRIFLKNKMTLFGNKCLNYYNKKEIIQIAITDLLEKVGDDND